MSPGVGPRDKMPTELYKSDTPSPPPNKVTIQLREDKTTWKNDGVSIPALEEMQDKDF